MCQYSLGDIKIARAEAQNLGLAEYRAESEKQRGCVGGLEEGETDLMSWARKCGWCRGL